MSVGGVCHWHVLFFSNEMDWIQLLRHRTSEQLPFIQKVSFPWLHLEPYSWTFKDYAYGNIRLAEVAFIIYISCVFIRFPSKRSKRNPFLILFHRNRAHIQLSYGLFRWLFSPSVTKNIFSLVLCFQAEKFALLLITLGWHDLLCPEVREQGGLALWCQTGDVSRSTSIVWKLVKLSGKSQ